jgi:hypothetical protein
MRNTILLFILVFASCKIGQQKVEKLDINTMKVVVWQLMVADEYYNRVSSLDSTWRINKKNVEMYQQIFDLNKVDRLVFNNTIDYLERHPIEFKRLMDSVNVLSKREKNIERQH